MHWQSARLRTERRPFPDGVPPWSDPRETLFGNTVVFSDPVFLFLFLPACLAAVLLAPRFARNVVLLVASLCFYAWGEQEIVVVMLASIAVNHLLGLRISGQRARGASRAARRRTLAAGIFFNLGLLVVFKYANWLVAELRAGLLAGGFEAAEAWELAPIHLPIGISFFTFQAISYVIDVYEERAEAQRNPLHFALYISLFPQLIAGPIVRYRDIAAQLARRTVGRSDVALGLRRFIIGLGKKVLIADVLAVPANLAFDGPMDELSTPFAWLGLIAFTLQIYFDFSGYSDMAIGLSRVFGFRLLENFRWPLIATSLTEFWRRWHISLSTWFRDYLYVPLGGNRRGRARTYLNLSIVFLLCGLWHGASWNFVLWGAFHGLVLVIERAGFARVLSRLPGTLRHVYLLVVVMSSWVMFRMEGLDRIGEYFAALLGGGVEGIPVHPLSIAIDPPLALALVAGTLGATPAVQRLGTRIGSLPRLRTTCDALEAGALLLTLLASLTLVAANGYQTFIYFRF